MTLNKQKKRDLLFASSALSRGCCCSYSRRNSRVSHALTSNLAASSRQGGAERREHVAKRVEREKTESWENGDGVSRIGGAGVEKEHEKP